MYPFFGVDFYVFKMYNCLDHLFVSSYCRFLSFRSRSQFVLRFFLTSWLRCLYLKSVALAMSSYAMSCFKLPTTICQEIDSAFSQFWWGFNDSKRRMAWVSWKKMSLPKNEGDLGFRDIENFNDALLLNKHCGLYKILNAFSLNYLKAVTSPTQLYMRLRSLGRRLMAGDPL